MNDRLHGQDLLAGLQSQAESWTPAHTLRWALQTFGDRVAVSSAFGAEGVTVTDMASRLGVRFRLFTLDTEFLFPETYSLMEAIERRYGITIERIYPQLSPEEQDRLHGPHLWERDPDQCCRLRKVEPLRQHLRTLNAWITSIRRDQTSARAHARRIEWDASFGLIKINPIVDWTSAQVWDYIYRYDVPFNPLHQQNYPTIGCTHCTRAVSAGEDPRAGRWPGFAKTECGLHGSSSPQSET